MIIIALLSILITMFFITLFSTETSLKLIGIGDVMYGSTWYLFPSSVKICILLMIQVSQMPRYWMGYRILYCNLETFTKVIVNNNITKFL